MGLPKRSSLWVVTSVFNPAGYRSRTANYRRFRAQMSVPVLAIELGFGGRFELTPDDADIVVSLEQGDVLWQKERLLNLALAHLPDECEAVAMVDADMLFADDRWAAATLERLDDVPVVQLYSQVHELPRGQLSPVAQDANRQRGCVTRAIKGGNTASLSILPRASDGRGAHTTGFAWAYRRPLLARHGLFDACVVGGGDIAIACASWGAFDVAETRHAMNEQQQRHYREWAEPWFDEVRGRVDHLDINLYHLWHGDVRDRGYHARYLGLAPHGFDPRADLRGDDGPWRWASDKPEMHRYVRDYFASRREDC